MKKTRLIAYLPIVWPLGVEIPASGVFEELLDLKIQFPYEPDGEVLILLEEKAPPEGIQRNLRLWQRPMVTPPRWLRATINVSPSPVKFEGRDVMPAEHGASSFLLAAICLEERLVDLVLIANIAHPGCFGTGKGAVFYEGQLMEFVPIIRSYIGESIARSREIGWPRITRLKMLSVYNWISKPDWILDGTDGGGLVRALNAFSYIFVRHNGIGRLLYSLVGIEALYSKGEGIVDQITQKTQTFLGPMKDFKKELKKMYQFRSRFVHGDMDFPGAFSDTCYQDRYGSELDDAECFGEAVLVATLQELVRRKMRTLEFDYVLRTP